MYGPDFSAVYVFLGAILAVPLLLGITATILAGSEGANSGSHLTTGRHLLATAAGGTVGCVILTGATYGGLSVVVNMEGLEGFFGCFLTVFVASGLGLCTAYATARAIGSNLDRYRCKTCGVRFRSPYARKHCPRCAEAIDQVESGRALAEFSARCRRLIGRTTATKAGK